MTLRDALAAKTAKQRHEWDMAATQMAVTVNMQRAKGKPAKPEDFHPLIDRARRRAERKVIKGDISCLKVFLGAGARKVNK